MDFGSVTGPKKIIPLRLRVDQQEYFGKKEVLLYVDVFIFKTSTSEIKNANTYCIWQLWKDLIDTLCIIDHVIQQMRKDFPGGRMLH